MSVRIIWRQHYPNSGIIAQLRLIEVGAVYRVLGENHDRDQWRWDFWLGPVTTPRKEGKAQSEMEAKAALSARVTDWLREAGLRQEGEG